MPTLQRYRCKLEINLLDAASTRVIIQHSQAVLPHNVTCWLRYFADNTFQFNGATGFVEFIWRRQTPFIHDFNSRYCKYVIDWILRFTQR